MLEIARHLGLEYRQHVDKEHSNEDKARVIVGVELPVDALFEDVSGVSVDWERPELAGFSLSLLLERRTRADWASQLVATRCGWVWSMGQWTRKRS